MGGHNGGREGESVTEEERGRERGGRIEGERGREGGE